MPETHRFCLSCGTDTTKTPQTTDPLIGKTLVGKYTVGSVLGSGAMGTIYKAEQTALGKVVVIKVLHRHLLSDPELIQRFHREARAASRLNHPNCVQIMDFGSLDDGSLYIAMEYIQGIDLATLLEREYPIDHRRLIGIMKQVCQALDEAHANGVLHRDLKPENIMIEDRRTARDFVKVVDFGIAKLEENNPNSRRSFQTRTGIVCGTPEYMSPEQARGLKLDARSDLYAVGVMLYHLTTDHLPFEAQSPIEVVTKHITEAPRPPRELRTDLPEALDRLVLTLLEKDREKRPASALDVQAELERIDRELAAKRREKVEEKSTDDATMVDMRPISDLVAAIETPGAVVVASGSAGATPKPSAADLAADAKRPATNVLLAPNDPTVQRAKGDKSAAVVESKDLSKAAHAGTATDMSRSAEEDLSVTDTLPDSVGRELGKAIQASTKNGMAAAKAASVASQPKVRQSQVATTAPLEASAREAITISPQNPLSPDKLAELDARTAAQAQIDADAAAAAASARPKKKLWLWMTLGAVVVAAGATLAVVLST